MTSRAQARVNEREHVAGLDTLRAIAIVFVFTRHFHFSGSHLWKTILGSVDWTGVDMFFVLSGLLVGRQVVAPFAQGSRLRLGRFYARRLLRTVPSYAAVLGLYFFWPAFRESASLPQWWKFLTFTQNFGLNYNEHGAFAHAWSLCIEEQFYLVLPLIVAMLWPLVTPRLLTAGVLIALIGGMLLRLALWRARLSGVPVSSPDFDALYFQEIFFPTYNRLDSLLLGTVLAAIVQARPDLWRRIADQGTALGVAGAILLASSLALLNDPTDQASAVFEFPILALGYTGLVIAALSPKCALSRLRIPGAKILATLAYAIYLTHRQVLAAMRRVCADHGWDSGSLSAFVVSIGLAGLAAVALHVIVEKPFLGLRDRYFPGRRLQP